MKLVGVFYLAVSLMIVPASFACPLINRLVDLNCDQQLRIAATGDSITFGVGDTNLGEDNGGWVQDVSQLLPGITTNNLGIAGITSTGLFRSFRRNAFRGKETTHKLMDSDAIVVEVGTNNFWTGQSAERTIRDLKRIRSFLENFFVTEGDPIPIITVATLPSTKRNFQQPYVDSVNTLLLLPANVEALNVKIRFDLLGTGIISDDLLHPNTRGYRRMAKLVKRELLTEIKAESLQEVGTDDDKDGVYDIYELSKFFTDPTKADTDGDGYTDGQELFEIHSDPLDPNSTTAVIPASSSDTSSSSSSSASSTATSSTSSVATSSSASS